MNKAQKVEKYIELMSQPEESVGSLPDWGPGKDEDDDHDTIETQTGETRHGFEEPETDVRSNSWRKEDLFRHALEMMSGLGSEMIEVDHVGDGVDDGEEQGGDGTDFVELKMRVEWNVLVK